MTFTSSLSNKLSLKTLHFPNSYRLSWQRVLWGAFAGGLTALLVGLLPTFETLELKMLEWRYRSANRLASWQQMHKLSDEISIINFDDNSQFELSIARFNEEHSQAILAQILEKIEDCSPAIIVIDLDLRGATCPALIEQLKRHRNIVITLFGSLEGNTDLPAFEYLKHAQFGYEEIPREANGQAYQIPISNRTVGNNPQPLHSNNLTSLPALPALPARVPSLTEAVIDLNRRIRGVGPTTEYLVNRFQTPLYFSYKGNAYPSLPLIDVVKGHYHKSFFKDRIVLIGYAFTPRENNDFKEFKSHDRKSRLLTSNVETQANAITTLLNNEQLSSCPKYIEAFLTLLIGIIFGGISSILPLRTRLLFFTMSEFLILCYGQILFSIYHQVNAMVPVIVTLIVCFGLSTFIYLDTDLRKRNRELAQARESMQVRAEEERQRIAEDLHDETLPALSAVARMADKLTSQFSDNPIPRQMRERLDFSVEEMRRVINDLHPSVLETMGFIPALENLLNLTGKEGEFAVRFSAISNFDEEKLSKFVKLQLYRIVQEALNNVQKHAQSTLVQVNIWQEADYLVVSIKDNGIGTSSNINQSKVNQTSMLHVNQSTPTHINIGKQESHGILNIKQRSQLIGAKVEWQQPKEFSSGTEVLIRIPC